MTTGIGCPTCGALTQPGEPCRGCDEKEMKPAARVISRLFLGRPLRADDQRQRMP
jgi:hypothetical protein